ncbi:MAG: ABC transporter ATP-binding protein, partial [Pseudomonadota bacterium]
MTELIATDLNFTAKDTPLVQEASFRLAPGDFVALLGPNGAGKTSLIRASLGLEKPSAGTVTLGGEDISTLSARERARRVAYLPQIRPLAWPNTVRDVVALG